MIRRVRLLVDGTGLHWDREYGLDRRTGWTAEHRGCIVCPEFVSLPRAIVLLVAAIRQEKER